MKENNKLLSLLGLAQKAGKVKSGEFNVETEVKVGRAKLVLLAEDTSENTRKKFENMCSYYGVPAKALPVSKEELGRSIGREMRSAAAVTDEGFAEGLLRLLDGNRKTTED